MLPRYRISLYSEGPKEFRAAGAVFRVASLYVGLAAGFASSLSSVASSVGSWIRAFFVCLFLSFFLLFSGVSVDVISIVSLVGGNCATPRLRSGVIAAVIVATFGVGGGLSATTTVVAKLSLVCFGPGELVFSPVATLVCLDFIPPLGDASLPAVLVGFRFPFAVRLVIVALVASVREGRMAESGIR